MTAGSSLVKASRKPIRIKPSKRGSLHDALDIPRDKPIPTSTINSRLPGASGNLREKLQFAKNAKGFRH